MSRGDSGELVEDMLKFEGLRRHWERVSAPSAVRLLAPRVVPVALFIDFWFAAFAAFSWCGLNYCLNAPSDGGTTVGYLAGVWVVTFLAVALPPWIPGGRRPAIAATIGPVTAAVAALYAFRAL